MNCVKCKTAMEAVTYQEIEVDRCPACHGIWFDLLEHEDLKKLAGSEAIDIGDPKVGAKKNLMEPYPCPKCRTKMIRMVDPKQKHIWYEACSACYGVFLDAGEFKDFKDETLLDLFKGLSAKKRD